MNGSLNISVLLCVEALCFVYPLNEHLCRFPKLNELSLYASSFSQEAVLSYLFIYFYIEVYIYALTQSQPAGSHRLLWIIIRQLASWSLRADPKKACMPNIHLRQKHLEKMKQATIDYIFLMCLSFFTLTVKPCCNIPQTLCVYVCAAFWLKWLIPKYLPHRNYNKPLLSWIITDVEFSSLNHNRLI